MKPRRNPLVKQVGNAQHRLQRLFALIEILQTQRKHASVAGNNALSLSTPCGQKTALKSP